MEHGTSKGVGIFLTAEVQSIHLFVITPLVKRGCCLVVLQSFQDSTVNHHLKNVTLLKLFITNGSRKQINNPETLLCVL
jgi:hypothetical protein